MVELTDLKGIALSLGVAIIILAFMSQVTTDLKDDYLVYTDTAVNNMSVTIYDDYAVTFGSADGVVINQITIFYLFNGSSGVLINNGNYTLNSTDGSIILHNKAQTFYGCNKTAVNASFHYDRDTFLQSYNSTNKGEEGLYGLSSWMPTLGLVIAACIIIGMLMKVYIGRNRD